MKHIDPEKLGQIADELDNLYGALQLNMPPAFHVNAMKEALPKKIKALRELVVVATGENPWEHHPKSPSMP